MKRLSIVFACVALNVGSTLLIADAPPATQPQVRLERVGKHAPTAQSGMFILQLRVELDPAMEPYAGEGLEQSFASLQLVRGDRKFRLNADVVDSHSWTLEVYGQQSDRSWLEVNHRDHGLIAAEAAALAAALQLNPALDPADRAAGIKAKHQEWTAAERRIEILTAMLAANQQQHGTQLQDRISQMMSERTTLTAEIGSKRVRLQALKDQQAALMMRQESIRNNDPVVSDLQKLVDLHAEKTKFVQASCDKGTSPRTELLDAQTAQAEADLRLAERRAQIVTPGIVSSLEKINSEISELSVDLSELATKLSSVTDALAPFSLEHVTRQSVDEAAKVLAGFRDEDAARQLLGELTQQADQAKEDLLRLAIVKVEPID